jgi:prevent-host-death family protein
MTMKAMISELKARLSAFLDAVRRGETVTVLDRRTPIARIVPLDPQDDLSVEPASAPPETIGAVRGVVPTRPVDVVTLLAESRGDR